MKITRKQLQRIIKEAIISEGFGKEFTCDDKEGHSNGFILPSGVYVDLSETQYMSHNEWIADNMDLLNSFEDEEAADEEWWEEDSDLPKNLISVSNPTFWAIQHTDWSVVTDAQIDAMIDCMLSCKNYTQWLKAPTRDNNIEAKQITFYHKGDNGMAHKMTFPEFIERYGNERHMERLFSELMGL